MIHFLILVWRNLPLIFYSTTDRTACSFRDLAKRFIGESLCGFLNSPFGGVFDLGVMRHTGLVRGFSCDAKQQRELCRLVDSVADDDMMPAVMPGAYTVRFVPVLNVRGDLDSCTDNARVMEVFHSFLALVLQNCKEK
jgi:hypothetical protein